MLSSYADSPIHVVLLKGRLDQKAEWKTESKMEWKMERKSGIKPILI